MRTLVSAVLAALAAMWPAAAQTRQEVPQAVIWNAGSLTFTKPTTGSQDCITAQTCLTRVTVLYNSVTGAVSGHQPCPGYVGPVNTEWALGNISSWNTLTYEPLYVVNECFPPGMVNQPMVLHLIAEDIYLQVTFNSWVSGSAGFSYTRTTAPAATASMSGRVLQESGRAIRKAAVSVTDQYSVTRTVNANHLGFYQFNDLIVGQSYTVSVQTRRFTFTPRPVTITGNLTNQDLICQLR